LRGPFENIVAEQRLGYQGADITHDNLRVKGGNTHVQALVTKRTARYQLLGTGFLGLLDASLGHFGLDVREAGFEPAPSTAAA